MEIFALLISKRSVEAAGAIEPGVFYPRGVLPTSGGPSASKSREFDNVAELLLSGRVSDAGPARAVSPVRGPAYESHRRTNPRRSGEDLAVYGDLVRQRVCRGMVLLGSPRAQSRF